MPELVSVLIPAYNAERWLAATIRSALAQTWKNVEVIVVDDGSRDGTLAVANALAGPSVKVVHQTNMGAPAARNRALSLAQGQYLQWLDADDLLDPDKIAAQMRVARELSDPRYLLSGTFGTFFYRPQKAVFEPSPLWRDLTPLDYFLTRFTYNTCFQTDVWLVSRELSEAAGPWTDLRSPDDDGEYFCRVALNSAGVKFVEDARTYYRVGDGGSLNNVRSHAAVRALYTSKATCIEYLLSMEDSPRSRRACVQLLQDWMWDFHGREDVVADAQALAARLGGSLTPPALKWKYRPIEWLFGYEAACQARRTLPYLRAQATRRLDLMLDRLLPSPKCRPI
jgi:glycosyltransferase involved in cell wall biosynthesis